MSTQNPNEYELTPAPKDGITALAIQDNKLLLVSSWDSHVRLYDLQSNTEKTSFNHKSGVLDCCFFDKYHIYSGGIDKAVRGFEANVETESIIGYHEKPVKCIEYAHATNVLITGSWDCTVKLWDVRAKVACIGTFKQPDKIFTMSLANEKFVVGTAGRHVHIYDLRFMQEPQQRRESSLKYQTRSVRCYPNGTGYALSSIEGRVAMEYFDPSPESQAKKYAFKCHRATINGVDTVYPVNALAFHQGYGTFATGGCDGVVNIWDGENKKRLATFRYPTSIAAIAFSEDGGTMVVASSYTFEEGEQDHAPDQLFVHQVADAEVLPKAKQQTTQ